MIALAQLALMLAIGFPLASVILSDLKPGVPPSWE